MSEYVEQVAFVSWFRKKYPQFTIFHIPNGELRTPFVGAKLKRMGVLPGVPDLYVIDLKLAIEMKSTKGALSQTQEVIRSKFEKSGHKYIVAYGFKDGVEKISRLLGGRP